MTTSQLEFAQGTPLIRQAFDLAARAHADQREEFDDQPYIAHPVEVARLLYAAGYDPEVVAAGLLHDTVERSEVTLHELEARFGPRVAALVRALTEPSQNGSFEQRKALLRDQVASAGADAEAIFAADKVAKSASLRRALVQLGDEEVARRVEHSLEEKLDHYHASLDLLSKVAADLPLVPRLKAELEEIATTRAHDRDFEPARRAIEAVNRRDPGALLEVCSQDVEWWPALTLGDNGGPYRGAAGIRRYIADLHSTWSSLAIELEDIRSNGSRVLAVCRMHGVGRRPDASIDRRAVAVFHVAAGKILGARVLLGGPARPLAGAAGHLPAGAR